MKDGLFFSYLQSRQCGDGVVYTDGKMLPPSQVWGPPEWPHWVNEWNRLPWEGRSESSGLFCFFVEQGFSPAESPCRHPSIRTLRERLFRSVQVGRSRFSRCCHLISDLQLRS